MSPAQCDAISGGIVSRFLSDCGVGAEEWSKKRVGLYSAMPGEVSLGSLAQQLQSWGAKLSYPRIQGTQQAQEGLMEFVESGAEGLDPGWQKGPWGILQPSDRAQVVTPESIDFVFVPGVAFGMKGERVGRGKGFYDRWLSSAYNAHRVALVFDFQVFSALEQQPWDQKVDEVWTESRTFRKLV